MVKPKETERIIELEYSFDRLSSRKIGQAYQLLVPEKSWRTGPMQEDAVKQATGESHEVGSNLRARII